jgi:CHAT domain-containing protein
VALQTAREWCGEDRLVLEYVIWDTSIEYKPLQGTSLSSDYFNTRPGINSYCLVLTGDGVKVVQLPAACSEENTSGFDYPAMTEALRSKVFHKNEKGRVEPLPESAFEAERNALYQALVKPVLPCIPANVKEIIIVPDGSLAYLPFDMLRENESSPDFGESYRLSLSPSVSVSVLASRTASRADQVDEPLLGFGGALYNGYYGSDDKGNPLEWKPLASSILELAAIRRHFNRPVILSGADASEAGIKEMSADGSLASYPIIHFACHGYFNPEDPAQSGLLLSEVSGRLDTGEDGNLSIAEVMLLNLNAQMVLLSACSTGLGTVKRGDGMIGLARSFMSAGSRNVGVSLWEIDDQATLDFMSRLYRFVKQDRLSFREAYYRTRNEFRRGGRNTHPYYWAAFTLYE